MPVEGQLRPSEPLEPSQPGEPKYDLEELSPRTGRRSMRHAVFLDQAPGVRGEEIRTDDRLPLRMVSVDRQRTTEPSELPFERQPQPELSIHREVVPLVDERLAERFAPDKRGRLDDEVVSPQEPRVERRDPDELQRSPARVDEHCIAVNDPNLGP